MKVLLINGSPRKEGQCAWKGTWRSFAGCRRFASHANTRKKYGLAA